MKFIFLYFLCLFLFVEVSLNEIKIGNEFPGGNELETFSDLPKIKTKMTEVQKQQIMEGVKGAIQFLKFLKEKNFFSMLTKISSVAGPIFSIISAVLSIAFLFIDIESPEMALMKKEFSNLNNRIDKWSAEFDEIKRKIDWSSVQIGFADIENTILSLSKMASDLNELPANIREIEMKRFLNKYESDYKASGDLLYTAMINIDQIYSTNLFRASQKYTENSRNEVQEFMVNIMSLLTKAIQIEGSYVFLKYSNEEANTFLKNIWNKKLTVLKEKMEQIDIETRDMYKVQYETDLDNLLKTRYSLTNEEFNVVAHKFFSTKYSWRDWFTLVYAEVSGFKDHTVSTCRGTFRFRNHGRNIIVSSLDKTESSIAASHINFNKDVIGRYNNWNSDYEYSRGWVNFIRTQLPTCDSADTIASVAWGSNVWFMSSYLVVYQKNCVYGGSTCYNTFIFG